MFLCCCNKPEISNNDTEHDRGGETDVEQQETERSQSLSKMLYNRIGKVEKFKHGSTILFLGKAFVLAVVIIVLVQFVASTEICYFDGDISQLPPDLQKILLSDNLESYRCPYNEKLDVEYTFELVADDSGGGNSGNDTLSSYQHNVTAIKVNIADIVTTKRQNAEAGQSATELCGKLCSVRSCKCFTKMVLSQQCYIDTYEYGLQVEKLVDNEDGHGHGMFSYLFVFYSMFILFFLIGFYLVYRVTSCVCGGKRESTANIG